MDNFKKAVGKGFTIFCKFTCAVAGGVMVYEGWRLANCMIDSIVDDISGKPEPKLVETEAE